MKEYYVISFGNVTVCKNTRYLNPGDWFLCEDRRYLSEAVALGACGVITDEVMEIDIPQILCNNPRKKWSELAVLAYPGMPKFVAGVTGTNGKTSTAYLAYNLLTSLGCSAAYIGTLGLFTSAPLNDSLELPKSSDLTTPDAAVLHRILNSLKQLGVTHVCMEVSSSGLDRHRVDQVPLDIAVFTSFSPEHLDIHRTIEEYWHAKMKIRQLLKRSGVFLAHSSVIDRLAADDSVVEYSAERFRKPGCSGFMASNLDAAGYICEAAGFSREQVEAAINGVDLSVPGRMEVISDSPRVIVDFAHTPDALEKVLQEIEGDKVLVFGCGGDRDSPKRALMGKIAQKLAKIVIVTDDNPRTEDPAEIRRQIIAACPKAIEIPDRREAIRLGISLIHRPSNHHDPSLNLTRDLTCIIAGKGHESYQIYQRTKTPFSDAAVAREYLDDIRKGMEKDN